MGMARDFIARDSGGRAQLWLPVSTTAEAAAPFAGFAKVRIRADAVREILSREIRASTPPPLLCSGGFQVRGAQLCKTSKAGAASFVVVQTKIKGGPARRAQTQVFCH
jgi:hypothetical protein